MPGTSWSAHQTTFRGRTLKEAAPEVPLIAVRPSSPEQACFLGGSLCCKGDTSPFPGHVRTAARPVPGALRGRPPPSRRARTVNALSPQLKPAGTACRGPSNACDLPESCSGASPHCPANVHLHDGHPCQGVDGYCYNGVCQTHEQQCVTLWGPGTWGPPLRAGWGALSCPMLGLAPWSGWGLPGTGYNPEPALRSSALSSGRCVGTYCVPPRVTGMNQP